MKKYSILIVGINCYFGHISEFIINLKKKNPLVDITLITSPLPNEISKNFQEYTNRIVVFNAIGNRIVPKFLSKWVNAMLCYSQFFWLHLRNHFDIVDLHFVKPFIKYAMPVIKRMTKNVLITPWGSDVLRVEDEKSIKELIQIYSQANYITVSRDSQIGRHIVSKFKVNPVKMVKLGWGGEFFDYIQENSGNTTIEEAKDRFGLKDKYVITCGYNTQKSQRHEEILKAIHSVKEQLPDNLTLLIPCTYVFYRGKSEQKKQYVEFLKEKGKELGLDIVVVEEHLDLADLLKLRMATDIFVHIQSTDAGSRSVMEYVACNKKLVHGAWVRYAYLEDNKPSCYFPVDSIENLGAVIVKAYQSEVKELPVGVITAVKERGWNYKMTLWNDFFESLVS